MVNTQNLKMPGVVFSHDVDATADLLNAEQQFLATEITERTRDMMQYPGYSWGIRVATVQGQSVTITAGVGIDKYGARLVHPHDASYGIKPPVNTNSSTTNSFYLCVKALPENALYKVHPYDGTRKPIETVIGLEFFSELLANATIDSYGNKYPSNSNGLIIAKLSVNGSSYVWDDISAGTRSPVLKMRDGS
jgi:hypothetical protein